MYDVTNSMLQNPSEKQKVTQLVNKFSTFYVVQWFTTVFTNADSVIHVLS
jgi:hypothetical protein